MPSFFFLSFLSFLLFPTSAPQQPSFKSNTLAVRVDVLVTDGRKPVAGLAAEDFELRDNGVVQAVTVVDTSDVPINVVLALDVSGSTTGARQTDLVAASDALLDGLKADDRAALVTFSHAVLPRMTLTNELSRVRDQLRRVVPAGRTALLDGTYVALASTLAQPGRSLVVVCTDGSDISSWLRPEEVVESATRANAVMYGVTTADVRRVAALSDVVAATGGGMLRVGSTADIRAAFQKILQEFRTRYILAYTPSGVSPGGFHRLEVKTKRRGLDVRSRPGYIGMEGAR